MFTLTEPSSLSFSDLFLFPYIVLYIGIIHILYFSGDVNLLSAVLEGGAPVDTAFTAKESMSKAARKNLTHASGGDTALIISARRGHVNSVRLCLQYGAKNDPYTEGKISTLVLSCIYAL